MDDDPDLLDGLRVRLRQKRREWETVFVESACAALRAIEETDFDVVVADMRMPVMDGAELLATVRQNHPGIVRIMLSGQVELGALLRAASVAQRLFHKPCDVDRLLADVEHLLELRDSLSHPALLRVLARVDQLPRQPELFMRLQALLERPQATLAQVSELVKRDVATTALVMQTANSGLLGLARRIACVDQAISYLGIDTVRALALAAGVLEARDEPLAGLGSLAEFNRRSFRVANLASRILPGRLSFTGGLLHDLGCLILARAFPADCRKVAEQVALSERARIQVENEVIGVSHAEVGAHQLARWGLPSELVELVAYHHRPPPSTTGELSPVGAVHIAQAMVDRDPVCEAYLASVAGTHSWENLVALANSRHPLQEVNNDR